MTYHTGRDIQRPYLPNAGAGDLLDGIAIDAGDLFQWFKDCYDDVESFIVQEAEGFCRFYPKIGDETYDVLCSGFYNAIVKIGDTVYKALPNCVSAVVGTIEFVFRNRGVLWVSDRMARLSLPMG
jgi:hypothetical protein